MTDEPKRHEIDEQKIFCIGIVISKVKMPLVKEIPFFEITVLKLRHTAC